MAIDAQIHRALTNLAARDYATAERLVREVLNASSDDLNAWYVLGLIEADQRRLESALSCFERVLRRQPRWPDAWARRADAEIRLGRFAAAITSYDQALAQDPRQHQWWFQRGTALHSLKQHAAALDSFRRALELAPQEAAVLSAQGVVLESLGRRAEAAECYRRAIVQRPNYATPHSNLGRLQRESGDLSGAIASLRRAIALQPDFAMAYANLGCALYDCGELADSIATYRRALAIDPRLPGCQFNLALALLKAGDFELGWPAFEARLHNAPIAPILIPGLERWDGRPLDGRTLVLVAEHGYGDVIHFCRYAGLLKARGIRPLLQVEPRLTALLTSSGYFAEVVPPGTAFAPESHVWYPLMSLPLLFGTQLRSIPAPVPYLHAQADGIARWRHLLEPLAGVRVGIAWQGNALSEHGSLRGRSMPLAALAPLAGLEGISLISLQTGPAAGQLTQAHFRGRITDLSDELDLGPDAFVDTAAVIEGLDLVISVDTAIAHLAGALGRPTWVALHRASDWRWLTTRSDTPWYPTMRLFRQPTADDWSPVVRSMCEAINGRMHQPAPGAEFDRSGDHPSE